MYKDPYLGWSDYVRDGIETYDIPNVQEVGTNIEIDQFVEPIAEELGRIITSQDNALLQHQA